MSTMYSTHRAGSPWSFVNSTKFLCDTLPHMSIGTGVVRAVALQQIDNAPHAQCILQLRGLPPFYSRKYDLKNHPNYRYTAEADKKKNAFSLERLINRRMKTLNPNEQYTVYEAAVPDGTDIDEDEDILNYDDLDDPDAFV